jgi:hypothetical protein
MENHDADVAFGKAGALLGLLTPTWSGRHDFLFPNRRYIVVRDDPIANRRRCAEMEVTVY